MDTEERIAALEKQVNDVDTGRRLNTKKLRNYRAVLILGAFVATLFGLQVEKVSASKDGTLDISFREIGYEAITAGLVAASLVAGGDAKAILDRLLRK